MNDNTIQQSFGQTVVNIYAAPAEAFTAIMLAPSWFAPLSLVMLSGLAATGFYFSGLDMAWWVDDTLRQANIEPSELDTARDAVGGMTRGMLFGFGAIPTVLFSFLVALVQAMYMSLAAAIMGSVYKFKHWMALASWTSLTYCYWRHCDGCKHSAASQRSAKLLRSRSNKPSSPWSNAYWHFARNDCQKRYAHHALGNRPSDSRFCAVASN